MSQQQRRRFLPRSRYDAAGYWNTKLAQDPEVPRTHTYLAPLLIERAETMGEQGAAAQAMRHLKAACDLDPRNGNARNDFGLALMKAGRRELAIEEFLKGLKYTPNNVLLRKSLSAAYARVGIRFAPF